VGPGANHLHGDGDGLTITELRQFDIAVREDAGHSRSLEQNERLALFRQLRRHQPELTQILGLAPGVGVSRVDR